MRLLIYKVLTQLIIILGELRSRNKLSIQRIVRRDRTFFNEISEIRAPSWGVFNECCDCGLAHRLWLDGEGLYQRPERPEGYDYGWRRYAQPSTGFLPENVEMKPEREGYVRAR